jgi:hypothetical protein
MLWFGGWNASDDTKPLRGVIVHAVVDVPLVAALVTAICLRRCLRERGSAKLGRWPWPTCASRSARSLLACVHATPSALRHANVPPVQ